MFKYKTFLGISLIAGFLAYIYSQVKDSGYLEKLSLNTILIILTIKFIILIINSYFNIELLKIFDVRLKFFEAVYLSSITFLGNLFLPGRSGGAFRLVYLNKVHKLEKSILVSQFTYFFVVSIFINSFFLICCLVYFYLNVNDLNIIFSLLILSMFIASYSLLFLRFKESKSNHKNKLVRYFYEVKNSWQLIVTNKKSQNKLLTLSLITILLLFIENMLMLRMILDITDFSSVLFYNSSSTLGSLIGITPGSLGLKESFILFSSDFINIGVGEILSIALVDRVLLIIFSVLPTAVSLFFVKNRNKKARK
jgi:uncharacterized membrane protein YbhN (UPF0104 family)